MVSKIKPRENCWSFMIHWLTVGLFSATLTGLKKKSGIWSILLWVLSATSPSRLRVKIKYNLPEAGPCDSVEAIEGVMADILSKNTLLNALFRVPVPLVSFLYLRVL